MMRCLHEDQGRWAMMLSIAAREHVRSSRLQQEAPATVAAVTAAAQSALLEPAMGTAEESAAA